VFRIDLSEFGIDTGRIVFSQEPGKGTTALHIDFFPPSLQKRLATTNPRRWITGALGALAVAITAAAVRRRSRQRERERTDERPDHRPLAYERHGAGRSNQI
jgi:hypothetical protein